MTSNPGTYALIMTSTDSRRLSIGRLGCLALRTGWYVYVGSAFGPGGLRARLAHHRKVAARPHWHVDYLRLHVPLTGVWYTHDPARREHQWAGVLHQLTGADLPLPGFGSSDCGCSSHLVHFNRQPSFRAFQRDIRFLFPGHTPVRSAITV